MHISEEDTQTCKDLALLMTGSASVGNGIDKSCLQPVCARSFFEFLTFFFFFFCFFPCVRSVCRSVPTAQRVSLDLLLGEPGARVQTLDWCVE